MRNLWQLYKGSLTDEECDKIIEVGNEQEKQDAGIFANSEGDEKVRRTQISWIRDSWISQLQEFYFKDANANAFGFVADLMPAAQFGTYKKGDFYDWHYDVNWESDRQYDRKLSIVIQLSNPNDYEGGVFEFQHPFEQPKGFKERGSVLIFPSYITHRVTKITKGERKSLVNWLEGPRWR